MPSNWSMIDNSFPAFNGKESAKDQIKMLQDYMYMLVEQMKYNLENLDASNWNTKALQNFQSATTKGVEEGLQEVSTDLSQTASDMLAVTRELANIGSRVRALEAMKERMETAETDIAYLEKGQEETELRLDALELEMTAAQEDIDTLQQDAAQAEERLNALETIVQKTDAGATVGQEGAEIRLIGSVYINGKLIE